jgi:hypothetical protein
MQKVLKFVKLFVLVYWCDTLFVLLFPMSICTLSHVTSPASSSKYVHNGRKFKINVRFFRFWVLSKIPLIRSRPILKVQRDPKTRPDRSKQSYRVRTDAKYTCPLTTPPPRSRSQVQTGVRNRKYKYGQTKGAFPTEDSRLIKLLNICIENQVTWP